MVQVTSASNLATEVAKTLINDATVLALIGTFVIDMPDKAVNQAV